MTSPDRQRLAAALAKLDDPHIIGLLLEAFQAPTAPDPTPEPTQAQLIEDITPRPIARNVGRRWTTNQLYQLRAMVNGGNSVEGVVHYVSFERAADPGFQILGRTVSEGNEQQPARVDPGAVGPPA